MTEARDERGHCGQLTVRRATGSSQVASLLSPGSCFCHTTAAEMSASKEAASKEATSAEPLANHTVPRFDRDIREWPRNTSNGVSFAAAGSGKLVTGVVPNPLAFMAALWPLLT